MSLFHSDVMVELAPGDPVCKSALVDTRHFPPDFTARLLETIGDLDELTDGVLFHSENFQALNVMQARYCEKVKCVYIDPPYNTGDGDFPYKDNYQTSSWRSMIHNRLIFTRQLMTQDGALTIHIDEHEFDAIESTGILVFGQSNKIGPLVWDKRNPKGDARGIAEQHEYLSCFIKNHETLTSEDSQPKRAKPNAQVILDKAAEAIRTHGGINQKSCLIFREWLSKQQFSGGELAYNQIDVNGDVYRPVSMAWPNKTKAPDDYFRPLIHPKSERPCPVPERGWRNPSATMDRLLKDNLILFGADESTQPTRKYLLKENMHENVPSLIYFGGSDDDLQKNIGYEFPNPKPVKISQYICAVFSRYGGIILDYFAGSGTTSHAVINLNREDEGRRKFLLVEMADYFDTVLLPRIKKVALTPEWKDGKPKRLPTAEEIERGPRVLKVVRLESYEDTLNNLRLDRTAAQQTLLDQAETHTAGGLREQYLLQYLLPKESQGSPSLLDVAAFTDPTAYRLKVKRPGSDESREVAVDLLETFHWLLGLTVRHIAAPQRFAAEFRRDSENRLHLTGRLKLSKAGRWWFRRSEGVTPDGRKTLVVWRTLTGNPEEDNLVLDVWMKEKLKISTRDFEFDLIYVNGGNNLENLKTQDDDWKVRLIEDDFQRLMFAGETR